MRSAVRRPILFYALSSLKRCKTPTAGYYLSITRQNKLAKWYA
jgi:hypothetical protein